MKKTKILAALAIVAVALVALPTAFAAQGESWFDLEGCSMCKSMSSEKGLMENMEWENHLTTDGMMTVTVVKHGYEEAFERAMTNMEATGAKLMAGEDLYLCGFCTSYGSLHMAGANFENFQTAGGHINLVTSRDPAIIETIHAHGQTTIDEMAKMTGGKEKSDHPHEHPKGDHGHDH
jgi:hypothetical protein